MVRQSKAGFMVKDILVQPALNGVYRLSHEVAGLAPVLDGRSLTTKQDLLIALGRVLDFPDYYGENWDALEECLHDLSWHNGPTSLLIKHAQAIPEAEMTTLLEVFAQAAGYWTESGHVFSLFLTGVERQDIPLAA
jgi:RNAse (barnase) inhibitor barstar